MRWLFFLVAISAVSRALDPPTSTHANNLRVAALQEESPPLRDATIGNETDLGGEDIEEDLSDTVVLNTELDALGHHDLDLAPLSNTTAIDFPFPRKSLKRMRQVGYGIQWKKGLQNWVAFPLVGLVGCKKYQTLGRMSVGRKHGSCQKAFQIHGKWHQLDGCNPTTGMPKYLLNDEGDIIASCKPKRSKLMCIKEGKIHVRGTCEDPPPEQDDGDDDDDDDDNYVNGLDSEDE